MKLSKIAINLLFSKDKENALGKKGPLLLPSSMQSQ